MVAPPITLDELDHRIITELGRDGRLANTEIARRLEVSEATVRSRVQRLLSARVIQFACLVNLPTLGYDVDVVIGVRCDPIRIVEMLSEIAELPGVWYAMAVTGPYDLLVGAFFRSKDELATFLMETLARIEGVQKLETLHVLRVAKHHYHSWHHPDDVIGSNGDANHGKTRSRRSAGLHENQVTVRTSRS